MLYNPALDGVRALAILAVVFFHCQAPWHNGGFVGLDIFFVLSGYLITSLLKAEHVNGGISIGRFYARRALRLYPTLLLLIASYLILAPVLWPADRRWLASGLAGTYLMDYGLAFGNMSAAIGHTWSLGVEEKFYLLWPLLLPPLLRTRRPILWLLAAFVAATAWRYFVMLSWNWPQAYFSFDTRMSGILLGAIAALAQLTVSRSTVAIACAALAIAIAAPFMPSVPVHLTTQALTLSMTLAEICAFVIVLHASRHPTGPILASKPLAYIGRLSYGIYLWHFPLVLVLRDAQHQPWWITLSATLVFSFVMAAMCLHFVDEPIKRWREKLSAPRSQKESASVSPYSRGSDAVTAPPGPPMT